MRRLGPVNFKLLASQPWLHGWNKDEIDIEIHYSIEHCVKHYEEGHNIDEKMPTN